MFVQIINLPHGLLGRFQRCKATLIEQQLILLDWRCESVLFPVFQFLSALCETRGTQPACLALRASPLSTHI